MKLAIVGAGGHAKEVFNSAKRQNPDLEVDGFFVEPQYLPEDPTTLYGIPIKSILDLDIDIHAIHIAVGDIEFRAKVYESFKGFGFSFVTIVDPRALVHDYVIGEGTFIAPGAILTADVKIGKCVIINTGAIVSHDCDIEDFCNISPGSVLCGNVRIGEKTFIGAGSIIREKIWIRDNVVLGMGSIVTKNLLDRGTYIIQGNSTKKLETL
jgi:sugar O-acyltransferase (sialic acid O-acetyltransferase NeuD family)